MKKKWAWGIVVSISISISLGYGCIGPNGNKPPNIPIVSCPIEVRVNEEIAIAVKSFDPDRDEISYKVSFGDGIESEWSEYVQSGQEFIFTHIYEKLGSYNIAAVASDKKEVSRWSDAVTIKVLPRPPPIGPERVMFCVGPDDDFPKIAALGITVIQSYELPYLGLYKFDRIERPEISLSSLIQSSISFLDRANQSNLRVYYSIASMVHNQILATGTWNRNDVAEIIESCKDHPALFCWQPVEEANLWNRDISHEVQKEIYDFFKARDPNHPITQTLAGGTRDWDKINFDAMDFLSPDTYAFDGTGEMWGQKPLDYLAWVGRQERAYLDEKGITKPIMFIFQCCDEPAVNHDPPIEDSQVPLGHIQDQFDTLKPYGVFTEGFALWAWNGGFFGPGTSEAMYKEIKQFFSELGEKNE